MTEQITMTVTCGECGAVLPVEFSDHASDLLCPKCGTAKRHIHLNVVENAGIESHDNVRGKIKNSDFPSKKNPRVEFFTGDDLRKSDGRWMHKERLIDKDNDKYREVVVDPQTGEVIHCNEERLSEHFGHGSAKFKRDGAA